MLNIKYEELKKASAISAFRFFIDACKGFRWIFLFDVVYSFLNSLSKILVAVLFAKLIDYFSSISIAEFSWQTAMLYVCGIFGLFLFTNSCRYIRETTDEKARSLIGWRAQEYALSYIAKQSSAYLKEQKSGALAQRINNFGDNCWTLFLSFERVTSCFWLIIIPLFVIGKTDLGIMSLVLAFGGLSVLFSVYASRESASVHKESEKKETAFNGEVTDALSNILLIKMFGAERLENEKLKKDIDGVNSYNIRKSKINNIIRGGQEALIAAFQITVLIISLNLWHKGIIKAADVILLLLLLNDFLPHFSRLLNDVTLVRNDLGKLDYSVALLQQPLSIVDAENAQELEAGKGKIEFQNIWFGYETGKDVFNDFNLTIKNGERVGIVGRSGGGKSTLINLLPRNYDVLSGRILINGQDIKEVTLGSLKRALAVISQDSVLFHRPIKQNISFGNPAATTRQIKAAAERAQADKFIKETPHGYLTITGERGVQLSGGQRQRIAIARAILKKAPILILDEATSALDNETENEVIDALNALMKNKTVIAIAHRLSTLKNMDRIIVIDNGRIVEEGTPAELLDKKGKFAKLWNLQKR